MGDGHIRISQSRKEKRKNTDTMYNYVDRIRLGENSLQGPLRGSGWRSKKSMSHPDLATSYHRTDARLKIWPQMRHSRSLDNNPNDCRKDGVDIAEFYWRFRPDSMNYNDVLEQNSTGLTYNDQQHYRNYNYADENYHSTGSIYQQYPSGITYDFGNESCSLRRSRSLAVIREETYNDLKIASANSSRRRSQLIPRARLMNHGFFREHERIICGSSSKHDFRYYMSRGRLSMGGGRKHDANSNSSSAGTNDSHQHQHGHKQFLYDYQHNNIENGHQARNADECLNDLNRLDELAIDGGEQHCPWHNEKSDLESLNSDYFKNSLHQSNELSKQLDLEAMEKSANLLRGEKTRIYQSRRQQRTQIQQRLSYTEQKLQSMAATVNCHCRPENSVSSVVPETTTTNSDIQTDSPSLSEQEYDLTRIEEIFQQRQMDDDNGSYELISVSRSAQQCSGTAPDKEPQDHRRHSNDSMDTVIELERGGLKRTKPISDDLERLVEYDSIYLSSEEGSEDKLVEENCETLLMSSVKVDAVVQNLAMLDVVATKDTVLDGRNTPRQNSTGSDVLETGTTETADERTTESLLNFVDSEFESLDLEKEVFDSTGAPELPYFSKYIKVHTPRNSIISSTVDITSSSSSQSKILSVVKKRKSKRYAEDQIALADGNACEIPDNQYHSLPDVRIGQSLKVSETIDAKLRSSYNLKSYQRENAMDECFLQKEMEAPIVSTAIVGQDRCIIKLSDVESDGEKSLKSKDSSKIEINICISDAIDDVNDNRFGIENSVSATVSAAPEEKSEPSSNGDQMPAFENPTEDSTIDRDSIDSLDKKSYGNQSNKVEVGIFRKQIENRAREIQGKQKTQISFNEVDSSMPSQATTTLSTPKSEKHNNEGNEAKQTTGRTQTITNSQQPPPDENNDSSRECKLESPLSFIRFAESRENTKHEELKWQLGAAPMHRKITPPKVSRHQHQLNKTNSSESRSIKSRERRVLSTRIYKARPVKLRASISPFGCTVVGSKMSRTKILNGIERRRAGKAESDSSATEGCQERSEYLEKVDAVRNYWSNLARQDPLPSVEKSAPLPQSKRSSRVMQSSNAVPPNTRPSDTVEAPRKRNSGDLHDFLPSIEIVELDGAKRATIVSAMPAKTSASGTLFNTASEPQFDHIRYKILKSQQLIRNNILAHSKEAQLDGLLQYLQEYSFQELLSNNNVVIVEPVRTKIEQPITTTNGRHHAPGKTLSKGANRAQASSNDGENKALGAGGGGGIKRHFFYHPVRVNREMYEEELPNPDIVRNVRKFFEQHILPTPNQGILVHNRCSDNKLSPLNGNGSGTRRITPATGRPTHQLSLRLRHARKYQYLTIDAAFKSTIAHGAARSATDLSKWGAGQSTTSSSSASSDALTLTGCTTHDDVATRHTTTLKGANVMGRLRINSSHTGIDRKESAGGAAHVTMAGDDDDDDDTFLNVHDDDDYDDDEVCESYYVSNDILKKIRECGSSVTYYGGRVLQSSGDPPTLSGGSGGNGASNNTGQRNSDQLAMTLTRARAHEIDMRCICPGQADPSPEQLKMDTAKEAPSMQVNAKIQRADAPVKSNISHNDNAYWGIKFKLLKSNSCDSRLELADVADLASDSPQTTGHSSSASEEMDTEADTEIVRKIVDHFESNQKCKATNAGKDQRQRPIAARPETQTRKSNGTATGSACKTSVSSGEAKVLENGFGAGDTAARPAHGYGPEPNDTGQRRASTKAMVDADGRTLKVCRNKNVDLAFQMVKQTQQQQVQSLSPLAKCSRDITKIYGHSTAGAGNVERVESETMPSKRFDGGGNARGGQEINSPSRKSDWKGIGTIVPKYAKIPITDSAHIVKADYMPAPQQKERPVEKIHALNTTNSNASLIGKTIVRQFVANDSNLFERRKFDDIEFEEFEVYDMTRDCQKASDCACEPLEVHTTATGDRLAAPPNHRKQRTTDDDDDDGDGDGDGDLKSKSDTDCYDSLEEQLCVHNFNSTQLA